MLTSSNGNGHQPETVLCECLDPAHHGRPCVPIPVQHVRYLVRIGSAEEGLIKLCAHCFTNAHHAVDEYRWNAKKREARHHAG